MGIDYKNKVAAKVMKKFGEDVTLSSVGGTHRAIIKQSTMALDNASRAHDYVHFVSFMEPMPADPMIGITVTATGTGDQYILGQCVANQGYIKQFEASLK